jgi:hypothetical protein
VAILTAQPNRFADTFTRNVSKGRGTLNAINGTHQGRQARWVRVRPAPPDAVPRPAHNPMLGSARSGGGLGLHVGGEQLTHAEQLTAQWERVRTDPRARQILASNFIELNIQRSTGGAVELFVTPRADLPFAARMVANGIYSGTGNNGFRTHFQVEKPPSEPPGWQPQSNQLRFSSAAIDQRAPPPRPAVDPMRGSPQSGDGSGLHTGGSTATNDAAAASNDFTRRTSIGNFTAVQMSAIKVEAGATSQQHSEDDIWMQGERRRDLGHTAEPCTTTAGAAPPGIFKCAILHRSTEDIPGVTLELQKRLRAAGFLVFTLPAQAAQSVAAAHPIDAAWLRKRRSRVHLQRLLIKQQLVAEHHMTTMARWFSVVSGQPAIVLLQDPFAWQPGDPADGALCVVHSRDEWTAACHTCICPVQLWKRYHCTVRTTLLADVAAQCTGAGDVVAQFTSISATTEFILFRALLNTAGVSQHSLSVSPTAPRIIEEVTYIAARWAQATPPQREPIQPAEAIWKLVAQIRRSREVTRHQAHSGPNTTLGITLVNADGNCLDARSVADIEASSVGLEGNIGLHADDCDQPTKDLKPRGAPQATSVGADRPHFRFGQARRAAAALAPTLSIPDSNKKQRLSRETTSTNQRPGNRNGILLSALLDTASSTATNTGWLPATSTSVPPTQAASLRSIEQQFLCQLWGAVLTHQLPLPPAWCPQIDSLWDHTCIQECDLSKFTLNPRDRGLPCFRLRRGFSVEGHTGALRSVLPTALNVYARFLLLAARVLMQHYFPNRTCERSDGVAATTFRVSDSYWQAATTALEPWRYRVLPKLKAAWQRWDNPQGKSLSWTYWTHYPCRPPLPPLTPENIALIQRNMRVRHSAWDALMRIAPGSAGQPDIRLAASSQSSTPAQRKPSSLPLAGTSVMPTASTALAALATAASLPCSDSLPLPTSPPHNGVLPTASAVLLAFIVVGLLCFKGSFDWSAWGSRMAAAVHSSLRRTSSGAQAADPLGVRLAPGIARSNRRRERPHHAPSRAGAEAPPSALQQTWALLPGPWDRRTRPADSTGQMSPNQLLARGRQLQQLSRAESTRKKYLHWWLAFAEFTVSVGWASNLVHVPIPISADVMLMWIAFLSEKYAASTISISLAAISAVHSSHDIASPTLLRSVTQALEGHARTAPSNGVSRMAIIMPDHIRMFLALDYVIDHKCPRGEKRWSELRRLRAVAMACIGFIGFFRVGELNEFDICDVSRQHDGTTFIVKQAKNDQTGRGRSTVIGARVGDAAQAEQCLWNYINAAGLKTCPDCSKRRFPANRCTACGPLFPTLVGCNPIRVSKKPWGKSRVTEELRGLLYECVRRRWLPANFGVRELSGISLRRGGNSAAAAAGVSGIVRASQGRWRCVETPDEHYTSIHHSVMVNLASTLFSNSAEH